MSRHGDITLAWGDGEYRFRLGIGELRQLQEACNAGPPVIAQRLRDGTWMLDDIRETLRLGRIGAGQTQPQALRDINRFVDSRPLAENALIALAVLLAAIIGPPEEKLGKGRGRKTKATNSPTAVSPSQASTALAQ